MRVEKWDAKDVFDNQLPDDVKAIVSLLSDDYVFYVGAHGSYIDIYNDAEDCYLFEQSPNDGEEALRIFCLWVRAGMPAGFESDAEARLDLLEGGSQCDA